MKRRLTISILISVAAALLLAGAGTLALTRLGARQAAEDDLRRQAEAVADLIAFGQQRGGLTAPEREAVHQLVCTGAEPANQPAATQQAYTRLRASACTPGGGTGSVDQVHQRLCTTATGRLDSVMPSEVTAARGRFCIDATETNLDTLRATYCATEAPGDLSATAQRRYDQTHRILCSANRRSPSSTANDAQKLQSTLSRQSMALVTIAADGRVKPDEVLPTGLAPAALDAARLRDGQTVSGTFEANRVFAATAVNPDATDLSVVVVDATADNVARRAVPWFLMASGITLALGAVVAWALGRRLTEPLTEATALTARIAGGDLSSRLPEHLTPSGAPNDELDTLAHSINAMADSLERSRGLEQQFLLSVSHDLRTPLTSIRGYAEALADGTAPDTAGAAAVILAEARRLERLVGDLLELAKLDARHFSFSPTTVDLGDLVSDSTGGFSHEADAVGVTLIVERPDEPVAVIADPDRLRQVVANLMENALKFAASRITVSLGTSETGPWLHIADDGPGIRTEDLPHVFERLYVTKAEPVRKETGSGIGLAIVHELVEAMGATVRVTPNEPTGTVMVVQFPRVR